MKSARTAELARGVPDEVDGHIEELLVAGQADLVALAQEPGVAEDQLCGQTRRGAAGRGDRRDR